MLRSLRLPLALALAAALAPSAAARPSGPAQADPAAQIDAILSAVYAPDKPGAAVIAVRDGKVIFRKGYGLANLELGTPMRPEMVFEIGSVTKQFTSTAILMLVEQGKIALEDDVRKHLPDFPDKGAKITVEHLLTHTSGIPSYTNNRKWLSMWRQDMTPAEIIAITRDEPLEFQPGTRYNYNNTGYVMLGAIIEKVSGLSYADFIHKNIFEPLGMKSSRYGSHTELIPNRASGYSRRGSGYQNAPFLSLTQPYAAGSLFSTVDDLARWDAAVSEGKLLSKASWDRAFKPYALADGSSTGYGYGWGNETFEGRRVIRHNGGIPGFISESVRIPGDRVYVALLTNSDSPEVNPGFVATKVAALAAGIPYREPVAVKVDPKLLDAYAGVYKINDSAFRTVVRDGDRIFTQRAGGPRIEAFAAGENDFFYRDSFSRFRFVRDASGRVTGMVMRTSDGKEETAERTDRPAPQAPVAVAVDATVLERYVGEYEIGPNFTLQITLEGGKLMVEPTGQPKIELFAASETEFFVREVDARFTFERDTSGKVGQVMLVQGGRNIPAKRIR